MAGPGTPSQQGLDIRSNSYVDPRLFVANEAARFAVNPLQYNVGMVVTQLDDNSRWQLTDIDNIGSASGWIDLGTGSGSGASAFTELSDTPSAYTHPGDLSVINATNDGLTFVPNVPGRTAVAGSSKVFTWGGLSRSEGSQVLEVDLVGQGDDFFHLLGGGTGQISTTTLQTYTLRGSGASSTLLPLVIPVGTRIVHAEDAVTFRFPTLAAADAAAEFFVNAGAFVADRDFVAPEIQAGNEITITEDPTTGNAIISSTASATQASSIPPFDPTEGYTRAYTPVTSNVNGGGLYRLRLGQTVNPAEGTLIETTFLRHGLVGATPYFFIGLEETLERATVTGNVLTVSYSIDNVTYTGTFDPADIRFQGATTTLTEGTLLFVLVSDITFGTAGSGLATLAPLESEDLEAPQLTYALAGAIISNLDPALNPTDWEEFADTSVNILGTDAIIEVEKGQLAFDTRRLPGDNIGSDGPFEVLTDQSDADSTTSFSVNWQVSDNAPPYTGGGKRTLLTIDPLYIVEPNTLNVPSSIRTEHNGSVIVFSLSGVNSGDPARSNPGFDFSGYTFRIFTDVAQAADGIRRSYVFRSDDLFTRGTDIAINVNDLISGDTDYILNDIRSINRMETLRPELVLEGREQANSIVNTSARLWTFTISGLSTNREQAVVRDIVAQGYINGDTARVSLTEAIDDSIVAVRTGANITNALSDLTTPAEATALGGTIVNFTDGDWEVLTNEGIRVIGRSNLSISNDNIDYIITDSSPLVEGTADGRKEVMIEDGVATYVEAVDTDTVTAYDLVFNESATRWTKNAADLVIGYPSQGDVPVTDLLATYRIELRDMSSNNIAATLLIPGSDFEIAQNVATLQVLAENIPANADYDAIVDGTSIITTSGFPAVTIDSTRPMTGIRPGSGITHSIDDDGLVSLSVASQSNGGGGSVTVQEGISLISPTNIIFGFITPISTANSLGLFTIRFSNETSRDEFFTILGATGRNEVTINHDITLTKSIGADLPLLTGTFPNRTEFQVVLGTTTDVEVDMPSVAQVRAFTAGLNPIFAQSTYTISHSSRIHSIEAGTGIEISSTSGAATLSTTTEETHVLSTDVDGALDIRNGDIIIDTAHESGHHIGFAGDVGRATTLTDGQGDGFVFGDPTDTGIIVIFSEAISALVDDEVYTVDVERPHTNILVSIPGTSVRAEELIGTEHQTLDIEFASSAERLTREQLDSFAEIAFSVIVDGVELDYAFNPALATLSPFRNTVIRVPRAAFTLGNIDLLGVSHNVTSITSQRLNIVVSFLGSNASSIGGIFVLVRDPHITYISGLTQGETFDDINESDGNVIRVTVAEDVNHRYFVNADITGLVATTTPGTLPEGIARPDFTSGNYTRIRLGIPEIVNPQAAHSALRRLTGGNFDNQTGALEFTTDVVETPAATFADIDGFNNLDNRQGSTAVSIAPGNISTRQTFGGTVESLLFTFGSSTAGNRFATINNMSSLMDTGFLQITSGTNATRMLTGYGISSTVRPINLGLGRVNDGPASLTENSILYVGFTTFFSTVSIVSVSVELTNTLAVGDDVSLVIGDTRINNLTVTRVQASNANFNPAAGRIIQIDIPTSVFNDQNLGDETAHGGANRRYYGRVGSNEADQIILFASATVPLDPPVVQIWGDTPTNAAGRISHSPYVTASNGIEIGILVNRDADIDEIGVLQLPSAIPAITAGGNTAAAAFARYWNNISTDIDNPTLFANNPVSTLTPISAIRRATATAINNVVSLVRDEVGAAVPAPSDNTPRPGFAAAPAFTRGTTPPIVNIPAGALLVRADTGWNIYNRDSRV